MKWRIYGIRQRWLVPFLLFGLCIAGLTSVYATAQIPENLIYEGETYPLLSTPLEEYFPDESKRPEFYPLSSACWRGYIGNWEIKNRTLFLKNLYYETIDPEKRDNPNIRYPDYIKKVKIPLDYVFPKGTQSPVEATWFSGVLRFPIGERMRYVHMGFASIHKKERYLTIEKGKVVADRTIDNTGKGATRSTPDLQWVALAREPIIDDGDWTDARLLNLSSDKETIKTRGILFLAHKDKRPAELWIPRSPQTEAVHIPLHQISETNVPPPGSHVEIWLQLDEKGQKNMVSKIRALEPGETIHHPDFKVEDLKK